MDPVFLYKCGIGIGIGIGIGTVVLVQCGGHTEQRSLAGANAVGWIRYYCTTLPLDISAIHSIQALHNAETLHNELCD